MAAPTETTKRKLSGYKATIAVAMSNYIEAGSIIALATSLSMWQEYFGLSDTLVGLAAAISANAFGAAIGAMIGGPLGDKYGRKFIYTYDLILYMIGTLLVVFAVAPAMFFTGVVLTGIAVGAGVPVAWTYIAEEAPTEGRARHVGTAQLAWSLGPLFGFLLATALVPLELLGSRIIFAHLFVIAFITWWVRRGLSESDVWKESNAKQVAAGQNKRGFKELISLKQNVKSLVFLFLVYGLWNLWASQAGIFMPRIYESAGVESATQQNLLQVLVWGLTVLVTFFGFMRYGDRVSRRLLYGIGAGLAVAACLVLAFAPPTLPVLIGFAIIWGVAAGLGAQAFYALWTAELFATCYRASAQGVLFFAVRIACGAISYLMPTLLANRGVSFVGSLMTGFLLVGLVVGVIGAPKTQGKSLKEIEAERYGGDPLDAIGHGAALPAPEAALTSVLAAAGQPDQGMRVLEPIFHLETQLPAGRAEAAAAPNTTA
ncbi:MAG: MFS transporter [Bifidobacteriaceae bacterium]|jgi:inositol transporter-like SP family MFS transporter|nr:MFS transporter [Bifidobacteriaceae bacterium]